MAPILRAGLLQDGTSDSRLVVHRLRVRHGADGGEAADGRGPGPGGNRLLVLASRLPQVHVDVDEPWAHDEAFQVDHLATPGGEAPADLLDGAVHDEDVEGAVDPLGGVDDSSAFEQSPAHDAASAPPPRRR